MLYFDERIGGVAVSIPGTARYSGGDFLAWVIQRLTAAAGRYEHVDRSARSARIGKRKNAAVLIRAADRLAAGHDNVRSNDLFQRTRAHQEPRA
jgi:hypothetical protein